MAGSSKATLVIEGSAGSGTLITAEAALRFDRDVLIVPGSILSCHSYAPNYLFGEGAIPVFSSEDILRVLGFDVNRDRLKLEQPLSIDELQISDESKHVVRELQRGPRNTSDLIETTGLSAVQLNMILSELELQELVVERGGTFRVNKL